jgi:hypothetical protein
MDRAITRSVTVVDGAVRIVLVNGDGDFGFGFGFGRSNSFTIPTPEKYSLYSDSPVNVFLVFFVFDGASDGISWLLVDEEYSVMEGTYRMRGATAEKLSSVPSKEYSFIINDSGPDGIGGHKTDYSIILADLAPNMVDAPEANMRALQKRDQGEIGTKVYHM